jgi:hypothetical protein
MCTRSFLSELMQTLRMGGAMPPFAPVFMAPTLHFPLGFDKTDKLTNISDKIKLFLKSI